MWRMRVDLPEPEEPMRATISPFSICRLMSDRALTLEKLLFRLVTCIIGIAPECISPAANKSDSFVSTQFDRNLALGME